MQNHLKRAVLCEELLAITDDPKEAMILKQLLYWLPRMRDWDKYVDEVVSQREDLEDVPKTEGWIYKSANELAEETMVGSDKTARRRLSALEEKGFIDSRPSPHSEWDNTIQYRVNPRAIQDALSAKGYCLETVMGEDFPAVFGPDYRKSQNGSRSGQIDHIDGQSDGSRDQSGASRGESDGAIPENTTETTTESVRTPARGTPEGSTDQSRESDPEGVQIWIEVTGERPTISVRDMLKEKFVGDGSFEWDADVFRDALEEAYYNVERKTERIRMGYLFSQYEEKLDRKSRQSSSDSVHNRDLKIPQEELDRTPEDCGVDHLLPDDD